MKRVKEDYSRRLPPVNLDVGDLERLVDLSGADHELTVTVGRVEYENVQELRAQLDGKSSSKCKIDIRPRAGYSHLSVNIEPRGVFVHSHGDTDRIAAQVAELLRERSPWYSYTSTHSAWLGLTTVAVIGLWIAGAAVSDAVFDGWVATLGVSLAGLAGISLLWRDEWIVGKSIVYIGDRESRPTFWRRNKDQLMINLIIAVVSLLLGMLVGRIAE